jgi:hypothetical protein
VTDKIKDYLASIGKKGGEAGKGKSKTRDPEHYKAMAAKSAKARKKRASDSGAAGVKEKGK